MTTVARGRRGWLAAARGLGVAGATLAAAIVGGLGSGAVVLRIEHAVHDFASWKRPFDGDPVGRQRSGVRRYRVMRAVDEPNDVLIDLEFDTRAEAEALLSALQDVWLGPGGAVMRDPRARIVETVETGTY